MPDPTITPSGGQYLLTHTTNTSGDYTVVFKTQNKFVEHDIAAKITTPAVGSNTLRITANATDVTVGSTATDGKYPVTANIGGTVTFSSAGWIGTSGASISEDSVQVGKITQSTLSSSSITPSNTVQTVTIGAGYYPTSRSVTIAANSAGPAASITSGSATITSLSYAAGTNENTFTISGSADISAPTVDEDGAGYVSSTVGTRNANVGGATVSTTVAKIVGTAAISGTTTYSPSISKETTFPNGVTDASTSDAATTTTPSSGVYVAVKSSGSSWQVTSTPVVTTAGYGTADKHGIEGDSATVTVNESSITYIKIKSATNTSLGVTNVTGSSDVVIGTTKDANNKYTITANNLSITGTVSTTAGWYTGGSLTDNDVDSATVGKIAEAEISGSSTNATASIAVDPGAVSITKESTPSGITIINAASGSATTSPTTDAVYAVVKATAAANSTGETGSISGSGTAVVSSAGYAPSSLTGSITVSGTATATTNSAESSITYIPITTATMPATAASSVTTGYSSQATIGFTTTAQYLHIPHGYNKSDIYYTINGVSMGNVSTSSTDPGNTYTALTGNNAPVVPSGGYLLINAGYHNNTKISLADIVPDDATFAVVSGQSADLLYGKTAYDNAGALVTGTIRTYDGSYQET